MRVPFGETKFSGRIMEGILLILMKYVKLEVKESYIFYL